jgi:hypothetical protein
MRALLRSVSLVLVLAGTAASWTGTSLAQGESARCDRSATPERVDGQIVKVDRLAGKVTVRGAEGRTYEFQASRETLQDLAVGDRIEATLRALPKAC